MKLTRSQKVSFGILAVAVGAFAIDRLFFSPAAAGAASTPASAIAETIAGGVAKAENAVATETSAAVEGLISKRLAGVQGVNVDQVRDAFAPSGSWVKTQQPVAAKQARDAAGDFAAAHKLTAVMAGRGGVGGDAIVDGQLVRVGQKMGEWRLASVTSRSAVFTSGSVKATLLLPGM